VNGYRLVILVAGLEVIPLEHARNRVFGSQLDHAHRTQLIQPFRVEADLGFFPIQDFEYLLRISFSIFLNLPGCERFAGDIFPTGIADQASAGPAPSDQNQL